MAISRWCCIILLLFPNGLIAQSTDRTLPPDLDEYIAKALRTFEVPGIALSIVKDGKVLLAKGYGVKKMATNTPVDAHTLFLIASNTKAFTATALGILVEEGKLDWDDPVIKHLPWFRMSDDYVTMHITIRDLLVHHSGLPGYAGDMMLFPPSAYTRRQILEKLQSIPLDHGFRTTYAYDNILYVAAGEVVSAVSGMAWEDFIQTRIFNKIGMKESVSRFSKLRDQQNVSSSHARMNGQVHVIDRFMDLAIGDAGDPAGGICSNATDMATWLITQLDSGRSPGHERLFKPATTQQLWKIVTPIPISKAPASIQQSEPEFWGYALGSRIFNYGKYKVVGHGGQLDGFVSQVSMIPSMKLGICVLTNQESGGAYWSIIYHIFDYYLHNKPFDWIAGYKIVMDSSLAKQKLEDNKPALKAVTNTKSSVAVEKLIGNYHHDVYGDATISKEDPDLVLRFPQFPMLTANIEHFQFDTFIARFRNKDLKADAYMLFTIDETGEVYQAIMKSISTSTNVGFEDFVLKKVIRENR